MKRSFGVAVQTDCSEANWWGADSLGVGCDFGM